MYYKVSLFIISSPYHVGNELPLDLVAGWDARIHPNILTSSFLTGEKGNAASVGRAVRDVVMQSLSDGHVPFLWTGDCVAPIAMVAALQSMDIHPTIIWFDAHGDFNTRETSWTGYLAGMSLAILAGRTDPDYLADLGTKVVPEKSIVLVNGRYLDPKEAALIAESQITHTSIENLESILEKITSPVYLHVDVDVIDPSDMPAMLWPAPDGPSIVQVLEAAKLVISKSNICAMSVGITLAENHPEMPEAIAAASVFKEAMASELLKSRNPSQ